MIVELPTVDEVAALRRELEALRRTVSELEAAVDVPLTLRQAAQVAGVSYGTARRWSAEREATGFPVEQRGRRLVIRRAQLARWMERQRA